MEDELRKKWEVFIAIVIAMCGLIGGGVIALLGHAVLGLGIVFVTVLGVAAYLIFSF